MEQSAGLFKPELLKVGESFSSYKDVESFIQKVEKTEFIQVYKRDAKTLNSMKKTCPVKIESANKSLVYYKLVYSCSKGGKTFKSKCTGKRKCSTFKEDCQMNLIFTLSNDGQKLVLSKINNTHNHNKDEQTFWMLPKQRKLNSVEKTEVIKLKSLKCNKILLKEYMKDKTGKNIILRDISNIKGKGGETDLQKVLDLLNAESDSVVQVITDDNSELQGIYFQSKIMKESFANYPEFLLFDATYKLNNFRMPLYILMVIDGSGQGQVAATFLLQHETRTNISNMIELFKLENPGWTSVSVIMTDKDFCERRVLKSEFQNAVLLLCVFHVLKSFRSNITTTSMGINSNQREAVLNILQKIVYSKTESEYEKHYKSLMDFSFPLVTKYYDKNWHTCRNEWARCFTCQFPTFGFYTNNHLESFNQKIKAVCSKLSSLQDFYEDFLNLLKSVDSERELLATQMWYRRPTALNLDPTEEKYCKLVTPFAFAHLQNNYKKSKTIVTNEDDNRNLIFKSNFHVTEIKCDCTSYTQMTLPCTHIFEFRRFKNIDLYCETLIPKRFLKETYIKNYVVQDMRTISDINTNNDNEVNSNVCIKTVRPNEPICTQHQKFKKAMIKCQQLATILSEMGQKDFNHNFDQLEQLIKCWNARQKLTFIVDEEENNRQNINDEPYEVFELPDINQLSNIHVLDEIDRICEVYENSESNIIYGNVASNYENGGIKLKEISMVNGNNSAAFQENNCNVIQNVASSDAAENYLECKESEGADNAAFIVDNETPTNTKDDNVKIKTINQVIWRKGEQGINVEASSTINNSEKDDKVNILQATTENVAAIKMPLKMKMRGRPKGNSCTVIGLKKKKCGTIQFKNKTPLLRQKIILLGIFKSDDIVNMILHENKLVKEDELPDWNQFDCIILEHEISLREVEKYFTNQAFSLLEKHINKLRKNAKLYCKVCNEKINKGSVRCDSCLTWFHKKCSCLNKLPKSNKLWFCFKCKETL